MRYRTVAKMTAQVIKVSEPTIRPAAMSKIKINLKVLLEDPVSFKLYKPP